MPLIILLYFLEALYVSGITTNQEWNDQCGNQHYTRELLVMGIAVPETCWAYKKYNKIISSI